MQERGFTITELMITLAIIAVVATITTPNLSRTLLSLSLSSATRDLASELQLARMKAIAQNTDVTLCVYGPSKNFPQYPYGFFSSHMDKHDWCPTPPTPPGALFEQFKQTVKPLPKGIEVKTAPGSSFTFNSRGQVNGGNITFSRLPSSSPSAPPEKKVVVLSTGRVRVCEPATDPKC